MEIFISDADCMSLAVHFFVKYVRAESRGNCKLIEVTESSRQALGIEDVPMMVTPGKDGEAGVRCSNPLSIFVKIAQETRLEEILVGKLDTPQRFEITSLIERASTMSVADLAEHLEAHLKVRVFAVGHGFTAADVVLAAHLFEHVAAKTDYERI